MDAIDEFVDRNTNGISSIAELARRMAAERPQKNAESWRKELRRWRTGNYKEEDVALVARTFNIPRDDLPAARARPRLADVDRRLAILEAAVGLVEEGETVGRLLDELATTVADVLARLESLELERGPGAGAGTGSRDG